MTTDADSPSIVAGVHDHLDVLGRQLGQLATIEKELTALRLEVQSWSTVQDDQIRALESRVTALEAALAGGEGG